jgi:hypothetical protein
VHQQISLKLLREEARVFKDEEDRSLRKPGRMTDCVEMDQSLLHNALQSISTPMFARNSVATYCGCIARNRVIVRSERDGNDEGQSMLKMLAPFLEVRAQPTEVDKAVYQLAYNNLRSSNSLGRDMYPKYVFVGGYVLRRENPVECVQIVDNDIVEVTFEPICDAPNAWVVVEYDKRMDRLVGQRAVVQRQDECADIDSTRNATRSKSDAKERHGLEDDTEWVLVESSGTETRLYRME